MTIPGGHFTSNFRRTVLATPSGLDSFSVCSSDVLQYIDAITVFAGINVPFPVQFVNTALAVLYRIYECVQYRVFLPPLVFVDHVLACNIVNEHQERIVLVVEQSVV